MLDVGCKNPASGLRRALTQESRRHERLGFRVENVACTALLLTLFYAAVVPTTNPKMLLLGQGF